MARGRDFQSMAERQHDMWQDELHGEAHKTAPGPPLNRCRCGAFAPYAANNFRLNPEAATYYCIRHCPSEVSGRADPFDL